MMKTVLITGAGIGIGRASALAFGAADYRVIVTDILAEEGVSRADPDQFLLGLWHANPEVMADVVEGVRAQADKLSGSTWTTRGLLKKARLPRLGKALQS